MTNVRDFLANLSNNLPVVFPDELNASTLAREQLELLERYYKTTTRDECNAAAGAISNFCKVRSNMFIDFNAHFARINMSRLTEEGQRQLEATREQVKAAIAQINAFSLMLGHLSSTHAARADALPS
jgi:hypothetical protein